MQGYFLNCDVSTTDQIVVAPTMRMSEEIVNPLATAITKARGTLLKFLTDGSLQNTTGSKKDRQKLASTKKGIQNFLTNSIVRILPMSIDKLQGLRCKLATIDEWLSGVIKEDPVGAIEQGASKLDDYLIIATSSEGTVRNGAGDDIKIELTKILKGEYYNPHVSIWWYRLDDISEVSDPYMWVKANPNLGKTVTYETYQLDVERAENSPAARNDIIAKRFGIPMEGYTYYFTYEETLLHPKQNYDGMECAMGIDLSQGGDFCSFTFLFPLSNGAFGIKTIDYISEYTKLKLPRAMRRKYETFEDEGTLVIMPGTILKMDDVYDDLERYIQQHEYDIRAVGYDPYNAKDFIARWCRENSEWAVEKVIQGAKTESVPLTEIKKLVEQDLWLFDEQLFGWTMGNCMVLVDNNGNKKLYKQAYEAKIDAVAAGMDAFIAYKLNMDNFG
jgi:phage terminase large subunit-like protein